MHPIFANTARTFLFATLGFHAMAAHALEVPGPVATTDWVAKHLQQVTLLDVRKDTESYAKGHIPGAVLLNWKQVRVKRQENGVDFIKLVPTPEQFEQQMQAAGVNQDSAVVVTSKGAASKDLTFATRLYWTLKYYGHDNVTFLDGGTRKWAADKHPLSEKVPTPKPGDFKPGKPRADILATVPQVQAAIQDPAVSLLDGRVQEYYFGLEYKSSYVYAKGHIPTAHNLPHVLLFKHDKASDTTLLRPVEELKALFQAVQVDPAKPVIAYCDSGHYSTGHWFVLHELLGNSGAASFDGSMHQWTKDKENPVVRF